MAVQERMCVMLRMMAVRYVARMRRPKSCRGIGCSGIERCVHVVQRRRRRAARLQGIEDRMRMLLLLLLRSAKREAWRVGA